MTGAVKPHSHTVRIVSSTDNGHFEQRRIRQEKSNPVDSLDTGRCGSLWDCLGGFWNFLAWLFSCCCGSSSEVKKEVVEEEIEPREVTLKPFGGEAISVSVDHVVRFSTISAAQERWHNTAVNVDAVVVLALQIRAESGDRTRWVMQTGVPRRAREHLQNALTGFYRWIEEQEASISDQDFEYSFARFTRNAQSGPNCIGDYDCYLDSQVENKAGGLVRRQGPLLKFAIEGPDGKKLPKNLKEGTLLQNRVLPARIIRPVIEATERYHREVWELELLDNDETHPEILVRKCTEKELRK